MKCRLSNVITQTFNSKCHIPNPSEYTIKFAPFTNKLTLGISALRRVNFTLVALNKRFLMEKKSGPSYFLGSKIRIFNDYSQVFFVDSSVSSYLLAMV